MMTLKKILELCVWISNPYCSDVDLHCTVSEFNTKSEFCYDHLIWCSADNDGNFIKFLSHYLRDWKPSFISDHEEDRCIVRSWRESIANENWLAPAKKEKLLTWGLMVAKTNGLVPIVKWFPDCQNKLDIAKTCLEWTRNLMFAISLADTLTILWIYLTRG